MHEWRFLLFLLAVPAVVTVNKASKVSRPSTFNSFSFVLAGDCSGPVDRLDRPFGTFSDSDGGTTCATSGLSPNVIVARYHRQHRRSRQRIESMIVRADRREPISSPRNSIAAAANHNLVVTETISLMLQDGSFASTISPSETHCFSGAWCQ